MTNMTPDEQAEYDGTVAQARADLMSFVGVGLLPRGEEADMRAVAADVIDSLDATPSAVLRAASGQLVARLLVELSQARAEPLEATISDIGWKVAGIPGTTD